MPMPNVCQETILPYFNTIPPFSSRLIPPAAGDQPEHVRSGMKVASMVLSGFWGWGMSGLTGRLQCWDIAFPFIAQSDGGGGKAFQKSNGLVQDGHVGPLTRKALGG